MDVYNQIVEPTRVSRSVVCNFTSPMAQDLVVSKGTLLQIFSITSDKKLSLISQYKVHGLITDIKPIRTLESSNLDYLVVSTKFAKLSIIKWNFEIHSIETISLHYYENFFENNSPIKSVKNATLVSDPNHDTACMAFNDLLAFLPFRKDSDEDSAPKKKRKNGAINGDNNDDVDYEEDADDNEEADDDEDEEDYSVIYKPTFIVPANKLDTSISEIISCKFLHNYREPTLAILYAPTHTWAGNLKKTIDTVEFVVLSLDLRKKTSTTIISLNSLPYDLFEIQPLKSPLNGCLLIGCNEIIHVDSSGSSQGLITNKYTENTTNYRNFTKNQNELNLNLEGCIIGELSHYPKKLILISEDGQFYWIEFNVEGRLVRSFQITKLPQESYQDIIVSHPNSFNAIGNDLIFIGCSDGDSLLLKWEDSTLKKLKDLPNGSKAKIAKPKLAKEDADDDDDILYSDEEDEDKHQEDENEDDPYTGEDHEADGQSVSKPKIDGAFRMQISDLLISVGPVTNLTLASLSTEKFSSGLTNPNFNEVSIVASSGNEKLGSVTTFSPTIKPSVKSTLKFTDVNRIWTLNSKSVFVTTKGVRLEKDYSYLITTNLTDSKSDCFSITENFKNVSLKTGFQNNELIITIGFINNKKNIVQITRQNIHIYDLNLKLIKTLTINELQDEPKAEIDINGEGENEPNEENEEFVYGYMYDNYALLTTSTGAAIITEFFPEVLQPKRGTAEEDSQYFSKVSIPSILSDVLIITGTITSSELFDSISNPNTIVNGVSNSKKRAGVASTDPRKSGNATTGTKKKDVLFLLATGDNRVIIFQKNHRQRVFQLDFVEKLSETLNLNFFNVNDAYPDPFIKQIMLVSLGDKFSEKEYLAVLTIGGETYLYELYFDIVNNVYKFKKQENTLVTGAPDNAFPWGTKIERRLIYMDDFKNGLKCLFITGIIPYFVIKQSHSFPRIYKFTKFPAISFASFKSGDSEDQKKNSKLASFFNFSDEGSNFIFVDNLKNARICSIPFGANTDYTNQLPITRVKVGESIKSITYHQTSKMFILSTFKDIEYDCVDEDGERIAGWEDKPHARSYKGSLKLLSPKTWTVIDEIELDDNEIALSVKSMFLNTSSASDDASMVSTAQGYNVNKRKKEVVVIGTGKFRMEDLAAHGSFHLFEVIDIIPEIGKPEFNHKLKEIFKESTKGAVTALTEISGRFLVSQGQKVIVRDLQEDNTVVPVAFLDTSIYVSEAKSFGNMLILGDIMKSIWFVGFDAEPYRMIMISKDVIPVDVSAADFISYAGDIYFVIGDDNENLHLLQYNPEDPASLSGQRLVRKTTFNLNTVTTCMRSFPKKASSNNEFQVVGGNIDGSLYLVTPVSEDSYRRMYVLQQQLIDKELHHLGLNPRMNRISTEYEYVNSSFTSNATQQTKAMIDFEVLRTFTKLNNERKRQLALKAGRDAYTEIWKDLVELNLNII